MIFTFQGQDFKVVSVRQLSLHYISRLPVEK